MWSRIPFWGKLLALKSSKVISVTPYIRSQALIKSVQQCLPCSEQELEKRLGFYPFVAQSLIPNAGLGLFIKGSCTKGQVICVYPGTVYQPFEQMWLASLNNHYVLSCYDGVLIDAKPTMLSKLIFKSVRNRVKFGNIKWIENEVPFARGHFANNCSELMGNVRYQELVLPPNTATCNLHAEMGHDPRLDEIRTVVLVATRDIENEEILASYHELVE